MDIVFDFTVAYDVCSMTDLVRCPITVFLTKRMVTVYFI